MIITQKSIPRRMVLRGLGASLALPLLDGMVPAFAAMRTTAANPPRRLGVVYVPNGMMMEHWTPATEGTGFDFPTILQPLEPHRQHIQVLSGMHGVKSEGPHARASTRFLTGVPSKPDDGSDLLGGVSMDQIAGRVHGRETQLSTLELALDGLPEHPIGVETRDLVLVLVGHDLVGIGGGCAGQLLAEAGAMFCGAHLSDDVAIGLRIGGILISGEARCPVIY